MSDMQKEIYEGWRIETLKSQLFDRGQDYIEEFIGEELDPDWDEDILSEKMNDTIDQMPEEELEVFMEKFNVDKIIKERMESREHSTAEVERDCL